MCLYNDEKEMKNKSKLSFVFVNLIDEEIARNPRKLV